VIFDDRAPGRVFVEGEVRRGLADFLKEGFGIVVRVQVESATRRRPGALRSSGAFGQCGGAGDPGGLQKISSDHWLLRKSLGTRRFQRAVSGCKSLGNQDYTSSRLRAGISRRDIKTRR